MKLTYVTMSTSWQFYRQGQYDPQNETPFVVIQLKSRAFQRTMNTRYSDTSANE